ncbi:MFS transporter [Allokutzneria albata]|uniref:Drug resistance transporter, EmrB/QacA subfamily n=1 Tax=Allokutzneria albata TaxID=211114 RepID=A0A1H0A8U8_ALLAB|nr:MFS transporter [Allokutzneria albata]SDN29950.1 drug resistance transporter, EmrB/QacA subfamily [Allokutzneria albata]
MTTAVPTERRSWLLLGTLLLGQFMALLDVTIVNVALPSMRADLGASGSELQLVVAGYTVSYATLLITGARLGALYGTRRLFRTGVLVFTATSLLCGLAPTATALVVARFVQGAGAALMMPQIMSVIQLRFTGAARAKALSAYSAVLATGGVAGLLLGGVLVEADLAGLGWRPVFLINVPIGIAVYALVGRVAPTDRPSGERRLDLAGLALSLPGVLLVVTPLVLGHEQGWPGWTFPVMAVGALLLVIFVRVQRRVHDPLLNLDVLRVPGVRSGLVTLALTMIAYGGFLFSTALHLQNGLGDTPLQAALTFTAFGLTFGLGSFHWQRLPKRTHRWLTPVGMVISALACAVVALGFASGGHGGIPVIVALAVWGGAVGAAFSPMLGNSLRNVPPAEAAGASGLLTTTVQLGQVVGVATFGTVFLGLAPGAHAISITLALLAGVMALGAVSAAALARA